MSGSSRRLVVLSSVLAVVLLALVQLDEGARVRHVDAKDHIATKSAQGTHGSTRRSLPTPSEDDASAAELAAASALRLEGLVLDQRQRPVAGANVRLGTDQTAVTEADGSFAFDGLGEGEYSVIAETVDAYAESIDVRLDDTSDPVMLELARGPSVHVRVTDDDGRPVAWAIVRTSTRTTRSDAAGNAILRAVDYDSEYITVLAAAFATSSARVTTGDDPDATIEHAVVLGAGTEVIGVVLDEEGKLVADASVDLEQVEGDRSERVHTDEHGAFTIEAIGRGSYQLKAHSDDFIAGPALAIELDGTAPVRAVVRVVRGAEVAGVVVDGRGQPIADADVQVGNRWVESKADGTFVVRGLEPGEIEIAGRTTTMGARTEVRQLAARGRLDVRLVLEPSTLAGVVVDANGQPVAEVSVFARSDDPMGYGHASTDEHGRFDLGGLPPGTYDVSATRDDSRHEGAKVRVATGERRMRLTVDERAGVTGTVFLDGKPVPYYGYELLEPSDSQPWSPTLVREATGTFLDEDVKPGLWTVAIVGPGFRSKLVTGVRIVAGRVTDLGALHVEHGRSLRGRVVDGRGTPVAGAQVRMRASFVGETDLPLRTIARGGFVTRTGSDGTYRLDGIGELAADALLEASHPSLGTGAAAVDGREVVDLAIAVQ